MNLLKKATIAAATFTLSTVALASNPIVGTWQTIDDKDKKPKALVKITEKNGVITGKVIKGYNAEAKKHVGKTVIKNLKVTSKNKYSGGKIIDPSKNKSYKLTATLNGSVLKLKGHIGPFYRTQTWKRK